MLGDFLQNIQPVKKMSDFFTEMLSNEHEYFKPETQVATPVQVVSSKSASSSPNVLEGEWQGTNYDPYDRGQNRPDATDENLGVGAATVKVGDNMVAVARKAEDDSTPMLEYGTVLREPESGEMYLVADLLNKRFAGQNKIDFATPNTGKEIDEKYNRTFSGFEVVREGKGRTDARELVESGEWDKMKKSSSKN